MVQRGSAHTRERRHWAGFESTYLRALRVAVLALASLALLATVYLVGDAVWRLAVPTNLEVAPTIVQPADVTSALQFQQASTTTGEATAAPTISPQVRATHAAFVRSGFAPYYALYRQAATAYRKPEDEVLTADALMRELGYDLESYASGETVNVMNMVDRPDYRRQAIAAMTGVMRDSRSVALLTAYRAAQRSEQECTTRTRTRTVRQTCGYYYSYDCSYTMPVQERSCRAVYPAGIVSPLELFRRADATFAEVWNGRSGENAASGLASQERRQALRDQWAPRLVLAAQAFGTFLAIMFVFLLIAIERHLRTAAASLQARSAAPDAQTQPVPT